MTQNLIPLASPANTTVTMTSRELVDFINNHRKKEAEGSGYAFPSKGFAKLGHDDFMRKCPEVLGGGVRNFSDTYVHEQNGQTYPCYRFPKREATLMAMSYSYTLQAAVYDHMTALEAKVAAPALPDFTNPAAAARAWAEQFEAKAQAQQQLAIAAPKVAFVDRYVESSGLKGFREVAKLLKANEARLREFLTDSKVMYRLGGDWMAYQNHIDAGRFEVKAGTSTHSGHAFNRCMFTAKGVSWLAGEWAKFQLGGVAA